MASGSVSRPAKIGDPESTIEPERAIDLHATPAHIVEYDHDEVDESFPVTIVRAVATVKDVKPTTLVEQVNSAIDPDRLEYLFGKSETGPVTPGWLTFEFAECWVTLTSEGQIRVYDPSVGAEAD